MAFDNISEKEASEFESELDFERLLVGMTLPDRNRDDMEKLDEMLRKSAQLRKRYLEHCQLEAMLWEKTENVTVARWIARYTKPAFRKRYRKPLFAFSASVILVCACIFFLFFQKGIGRFERTIEKTPEIATISRSVSASDRPDPVQTRNVEIEDNVVAKVVRNINATITEAITNEPHAVDFVEIPKVLHTTTYELSTGLLEIEYLSGARVVFHAPATFTLLTDSSIQLHYGQINVHVPTIESQGFIVNTPSAKVIDLGTEFAIEVGGKNKPVDEFHVFSGEIQIYPDAGNDRIPIKLKQGQAFLLDHSTTTPVNIDIDKYKFIRTLQSADRRYNDLILDMQPHFYVSMDPSDGSGNMIVDHVNPCNIMQVKTAKPDRLCWSHGIDGGLALSMDGARSKTFAIINDYPRTNGNKLTVTAWVFAETRPFWGSIAKNWSYPKKDKSFGQFHLGLFKHTGLLEAHIYDNDDKERFVFDSEPLPLHLWHHVAMVADETILKLYRNGKMVDDTTINGLQSLPEVRAMAIGAKPGREPGTYAPWNDGLWDGRIDHVAVFDYALSDEQIEMLFEEGKNLAEK